MGGRHFTKIAFLLGLTFAFPVLARCPLADKYAREGNMDPEMTMREICAFSYNDDESQATLAEAYMKGSRGLDQDEKTALYLYQLSAENGNADSQVKLAELLQTFDNSSERRKELKDYLASLEKKDDNSTGFSGEVLHPYTLLLLASERPENKWYYPSQVRSAPARTNVLLQNYKITPEKRQAALKDASKWKTRKLLEMAREVLSEAEYTSFENRLKNNTTRTEAMDELKNRLKAYVDAKQKERSTPL